jgi:hypothetical protein
LHPGQSRAWASDKRFVFIIAGAQSGKTSFGSAWLLREIQRCGPGDYLAVTSSYDLFKLKLLPEMMRLFCQLLGWGSYQASDRVIQSHDHSTRIVLRSANAPGGLESATAKAAWLDECGQDEFTLQAWEAVQRRLSINQGRVLGTTTPYNLGWLKSQVFDRWKGGHPDYDVIQFASIQNPSFPRAEYERAKSVLPNWKFEMFCNGNFSRPAGLIYCDYDDSYREYGGHLVKPFSIPKEWRRDVGIDFGAVNTALVWLAEEPGTGTYYAYRERLGGGLTGPEHAREALEYKEPVRHWLGGAKSEDAQRQDWWLAECPVIEPFITDVEAGIDRVIGLFKQRRLFVFDTLVHLRSELGTYSRDLDDAGEPLEKIANKERFHLLDALRAVCSAFPLEHRVATTASVDERAAAEEAHRRKWTRFRQPPSVNHHSPGW